jgi:hypothetical protein
MIPHAFFGGGLRGGFALAVLPLMGAMVEFPFQTPLVAPAGRAQLPPAGLETASEVAISLAAITVRTDEEETTTIGSLAKPVTERLSRGIGAQYHQAQCGEWTSGAR